MKLQGFLVEGKGGQLRVLSIFGFAGFRGPKRKP